ncbi:DUF2515 domain-containing protein [Bacillus toyonensis]|uniref:DUF2515 domain-containing protein n=1 Tax=Bacillus toyonensis TaxID=155322 RepID=UPI000B44AB27|nr:DUF2515 domain-containing protein [Bacillus toyonensis]OTX36125.1 hypothetical protein BK717_13375 [Bacillus thuringiensis serovar malayensis]OUB10083.1 hypothetical protein BK709_05825 [Bacillus thuringiensis serovar shandongiensis]MBX0351037.1 DUF2515 domain-containing protein [Bacillus toyonensis]MDM5259262.1 DUF2515 domain-containing protein [Bacillus toyonensis]MEC2393369.1 DUF2515 domain-containing protein [Bacillus toyonensis]
MDRSNSNHTYNGPSKALPLSLFDVKNELKQKSKLIHSDTMYTLTKEEQFIINNIKIQTEQLNKNNVTRTRAYYQFYIRYPEIHWALLGHMVSRNGGWNMTDLKGDLYTKLLSEKDQITFFSFLERGNWLIFQDVYPQFLLYEQSVKKAKKLFHLLPHLNVSTFMETMWNDFWKTGNKKTLAIATIINEQNYLEKRVIQNAHFQKTVLNSIGFKLFDFFQFNHILFPFYENNTNQKTLLIGDTMKHFTSLHERILIGKRLYSLLFRDTHILSQIIYWAEHHPHTGSRKDYWPHLFSSVNESFSREFYKRRIKKCQLRSGAYRIYSPALIYAWRDMKHEEVESEDWFTDWQVVNYLVDKEENMNGKITEDYCKTIEKIELAILAKKNVLLREEE